MEEEAERGKGIDSHFPSLVFLGTPDFAIPSLRKLAAAGAPVVLVITQPDRPKGRGKKVTPPPVKRLAEELSIPIYQPERIRANATLEHIRSFGAQCAIVVAFGQLLPQAFLDDHPLGALNVHASLLPRYRGAAPIQRSILSGDTVTGVSIMLLDAGMDTGPILSQQDIPIDESDTFGAVHGRLAEVGADLLMETLKGWQAGHIVPRRQNSDLATYAPPLQREESRLKWDLPAREIVNTIRAFDPVPGAFGFYRGKRVKFFRASILPWKGEAGKPGEIVGQMESGLVVFGGDMQALSIGDLQLEGQRRLPAAEFLRGHPLPPGSFLE